MKWELLVGTFGYAGAVGVLAMVLEFVGCGGI